MENVERRFQERSGEFDTHIDGCQKCQLLVRQAEGSLCPNGRLLREELARATIAAFPDATNSV